MPLYLYYSDSTFHMIRKCKFSANVNTGSNINNKTEKY